MNSRQITRAWVVMLVSLVTLMLSSSPVGAWTAPTHDKLQVTITAKTQDFTPASACTVASACFLVTTTNDTHDSNPGDGVCADSNGQCSLRAATEEADALPAGSNITITVPAGTYALMLGALGLTANNITINGAGSTSTIISGHHTFGIMSVSSSVNASLSGLTLKGGKTGNNGGGIENAGMLTVSQSTISGNAVPKGYGSGGGIDNSGMLTVTGSIISHNVAGGGGGIANETSATLIVSDSTFSDNLANGGNSHGYGEGAGGGIVMTAP